VTFEKVKEVRAVLTSGTPLAEGEAFQILAITAGEGNGWFFPADVLRASLPLWEGVETFIDHAAGSRSVRDLAGVCAAPVYDEAQQGVRLTLTPQGPSARLLEDLGRQWLEGGRAQARVGFSADLVFTARGRVVQQIVRIHSLDLVMLPARGGAFLSITTQEDRMSEEVNRDEGQEAGLAQALLEARLEAAHLPAAMAGEVRAQMEGKRFSVEELDAAIQKARKLTADLQGGAAVRGLGAISQMVTAEERLQAAVDDLLGAPRAAGMAGVAVERLSGIRDLYLTLTGDVDLHGGYHPEHARLATTATMPNLVKNALNKVIVQQWDELGRAGYRWWEPIVSVEHFNSLQAITGVLVGEVGTLPEVAEGGEYTELPVADSGETGAWKKYGGYLPLTLELIDRDETARLRQYPRKLVSAGLRRLSSLVAAVFTANAGVGPTMADGKAVFHADHDNLGTTALTSGAWETASMAIYNQPMLAAAGETAPKLGVDGKYLLVPREMRLTGMRILYPSFEREANIFSENMQRGAYGDVITCPEFTDANDWAAIADPRLAPAIVVGERFGLLPEVLIAGDPLSPALFTHDEVHLKVRHFVSVFVADYRPLFKANVAA
jgi:hypothetical protein